MEEGRGGAAGRWRRREVAARRWRRGELAVPRGDGGHDDEGRRCRAASGGAYVLSQMAGVAARRGTAASGGSQATSGGARRRRSAAGVGGARDLGSLTASRASMASRLSEIFGEETAAREDKGRRL